MPANKPGARPPRPAKRPANRPAQAAPAASGSTPAARPGSKAASLQARAKERSKGVVMTIVIGILTAAIMAVILLFGFQNGLAVTERCNCSWTKVIVFSSAAFLVTALQLITYLIFHSECRHMSDTKNPRQKQRFDDAKPGKIVGYSLLTAFAASLIAFLLVPLIVDQNGNFAWFFTSGGMGILAVVVTFVLSTAMGIFGKIAFTQEVS